MRSERIIITNEDRGERIDRFLVNRFSNFSRSYFQKLIGEGLVKVNNQAVTAHYQTRSDDLIDVFFPDPEITGEPPKPENISLHILYEDENVIVVNKQAGLVVHPAAGNQSGTLVNALVAHFPEIHNAIADPENKISSIRPGLVHRLDKDTTGVLIVAKNSSTMKFLSRQIKNRAAVKKYLALCYGWPKEDSGVIRNYLGRHPKDRKRVTNLAPGEGKEAISHYQVMKYLQNESGDHASLIQFDIKTGRTHQIRYHSLFVNHPVLGDPVYHTKESLSLSQKLHLNRQMLHAQFLEIFLPGKMVRSLFEAPIPADMMETLEQFKTYGG